MQMKYATTISIIAMTVALPPLGATVIGLLKTGTPFFAAHAMVLWYAYFMAGPGSLAYALLIAWHLRHATRRRYGARYITISTTILAVVIGLLLPATLSWAGEDDQSLQTLLRFWHTFLAASAISCALLGFMVSILWIKLNRSPNQPLGA